jgi:peptidoglycan/xylan/chitin deacetylase (PgdA/CDA1 family)
VLLTFDDGYRDVLRYAAPVLRRLHMPATVYVITERVSGRDPTWLSWADLRSMETMGIDVGSHTVAHRDLTRLPPAAGMWQLVRSRRALERHLHHPVQWFAYPFGGVDPAVVAMTRKAGYVLAVTTKQGSLQDRQHPLQMHRLEVLDSTGVAGVAALVAPPSD